MLLRSHIGQMLGYVRHRNTAEIIYLATRQYSRYDLVFLRSGQNEHHITRRLLKRLKKRVESSSRKHMHLVYDEHPVTTYLRRYAHLLVERPDILDRIIRSGIKLNDIDTASFVKRAATLTLIASLPLSRGIQTIDCLGKNTSARGLTHPARSAKHISLRQPVRVNSIFKSARERLLPNHAAKRRRAVLTRRDNIGCVHKAGNYQAKLVKKVRIYNNISARRVNRIKY